MLGLSAFGAPPSNDSFATRIDLGNNPGFTINATNTEATLEASEPTFDNLIGSSVWYQWTAPETGWVTLTTAGSSLDSVIGVFTGSSISTLTQIGFNDEDMDAAELGTDHFSRLQFLATEGTVYNISVSGWSDGSFIDEGPFTLSLSPISPTVEITALGLTPDPADITTAPASMTLNLSAGTTQPGPVAMSVLMHPANDQARPFTLSVTDAHRITGTSAAGDYQLGFTLPRYIPGGTWLATVIASDGLRDTQWSSGTDAIQDDFVLPTTTDPLLAVTNTGTVDNAPPVLTSFTATPVSINAGSLTAGGRAITFTLQITDNLSGFSTGNIMLIGEEDVTIATLSATNLTSGDALSGTYSVTAIAPYGLTAGAYSLRVRLTDASLFSATFSSEPGAILPLPAAATETITITGTAGYPEWTRNHLFTGGQIAPLDDPDHDGLPNLSEYAFDLSPVAPSIDTAMNGYPQITLSAGKLRIEFLRRKAATNSGLTYQPQFSDNLTSWTNATATPTITSIDDTWERVVILDTAVGGAHRFGRVQVNYTQP